MTETSVDIQCPVTGKTQERAAGGPTNRDWWPNQLKLDVLHQRSSMSNPMGEGFNYAKEFKSLDLQAVKDWRSQGLLTRESPVLKPGSKKWLPLHQALELQDLRSASQKRAAAEKKGETVPPTPRPRAATRQLRSIRGAPRRAALQDDRALCRMPQRPLVHRRRRRTRADPARAGRNRHGA